MKALRIKQDDVILKVMVVDGEPVIEMETTVGPILNVRLNPAQRERFLTAVRVACGECDEKQPKSSRAAKALRRLGADALPSTMIRVACRSIGIDPALRLFSDKRKNGRRIKVARLSASKADELLKLGKKLLKKGGVEVLETRIDSPRDPFGACWGHSALFYVV